VSRYRFIEAEKVNHSLVILCRVMRVTRSAFYAWRSRPVELADGDSLSEKVKAQFEHNRGRYGSRRIHSDLVAKGIFVSRSTVARRMRSQDLRARRKRPFTRTTDSDHSDPIAENLLNRDFTADAPNQRWVGDITCIRTAQGWLYLATLIDLFSRKVVGYAMSLHIDRQLVLSALSMATGLRRPGPGLLHHTDRGSQYTSGDYQNALKQLGMVPSMSRKGNCWDNAVAESFFSSLKVEALHDLSFPTREAARVEVIQYIHWYNTRRRHTAVGNVSPNSFESISLTNQMAA
jgi:transposase InsO family protein